MRSGSKRIYDRSPKVGIIGAQVLSHPPVFAPGNRLVYMRDIQELRGAMTHWQGARCIWGLHAEPVNRALSFSDSTETWIRCNQWEVWRCSWSVIHFPRELPNGRDVDWWNLPMAI